MGGQEGPPGVTKYTKETRRPTKKTNLDKHFCGLSNLKKYWSDTKKTKHTKTFLYLGWHHHVTMTMLAYGFLLLETLRNKKNFWVDPPESEAGDTGSDSVLVGNMPHLP